MGCEVPKDSPELAGRIGSRAMLVDSVRPAVAGGIVANLIVMCFGLRCQGGSGAGCSGQAAG